MSKFNEFLERLVLATHSYSGLNRDEYVTLIHEICEYYKLSKGSSEFYMNVTQEKLGNGNYYCDFDNGKGEKVVLQIRIVTRTQAIIIGTLYREKDAENLSIGERKELDVLFRVVLSFVSFTRLQKVVEQLGFYDENNYPNFRAFSRYLEIEDGKRTLEGKMAFHYDLRNFSIINQEIGRKNGDEVIRNYYNMIKNVIGEDGIICRLGGDKFIGIFPPEKKEEMFKIFKGVPITFGAEGERRVEISSAAGIYVLPNKFVAANSGDIMDKITMCSSMAKRKNEGTAIIYDQTLNNLDERAKWVKRKFRNALEDREFHAFYQPKVDIVRKEIIGAEALCRWFHEGHIIPPMEFIPILEQGMEVCDLDFYILDRVCADIRRWLDEGRNVVKISVNLSRKHLVDVDLLEHIMTIIDRHDVPHKYIEIELTETTTDVQFKDLKRVVAGLRREGVSTAVDDFGIGYSSLNLIREIPWDVLKVDKDFLPLDNENKTSVTSIMFRHVIALAQEMGLKCVVEGVESEKQLDTLKDNNCFIAQGFYFDKPLPVEIFEKKMESKIYE